MQVGRTDRFIKKIDVLALGMRDKRAGPYVVLPWLSADEVRLYNVIDQLRAEKQIRQTKETDLAVWKQDLSTAKQEVKDSVTKFEVCTLVSLVLCWSVLRFSRHRRQWKRSGTINASSRKQSIRRTSEWQRRDKDSNLSMP